MTLTPLPRPLYPVQLRGVQQSCCLAVWRKLPWNVILSRCALNGMQDNSEGGRRGGRRCFSLSFRRHVSETLSTVISALAQSLNHLNTFNLPATPLLIPSVPLHNDGASESPASLPVRLKKCVRPHRAWPSVSNRISTPRIHIGEGQLSLLWVWLSLSATRILPWLLTKTRVSSSCYPTRKKWKILKVPKGMKNLSHFLIQTK